MSTERLRPWLSTLAAVAGLVGAAGAAYGAVALASSALVRLSYAGGAVGWAAFAVASTARARQATVGVDEQDTALATSSSVFLALGAVVLTTTVPLVEPDWRPLFLAPAALLLAGGVVAVLASRRRDGASAGARTD